MTKAMEMRRRHTRRGDEIEPHHEFVKCPADRVRPNGRSLLPAKGEHRGVGGKRPAVCFCTLEESLARASHPGPERHQSIFSELGPANEQNLSLEVNVLAAQARYLPVAQPQAIQKDEDHSVSFTAA